jgi:hypothetical protein
MRHAKGQRQNLMNVNVSWIGGLEYVTVLYSTDGLADGWRLTPTT